MDCSTPVSCGRAGASESLGNPRGICGRTLDQFPLRPSKETLSFLPNCSQAEVFLALRTNLVSLAVTAEGFRHGKYQYVPMRTQQSQQPTWHHPNSYAASANTSISATIQGFQGSSSLASCPSSNQASICLRSRIEQISKYRHGLLKYAQPLSVRGK